MDFQYRGNAYHSESLRLRSQDKRIIGKYRGHNLYHTDYDLSHLHSSCPQLSYRGVVYGDKTVPSATAYHREEDTFKIAVPQHRKPVRSSRHHVMSELDRVHNDFLLKKLEQRMNSARNKGDRDLVQMLELEKLQLQ